VLADEINRAPAKVQSALLEAMGEHQVSVGRESFKLPPLFLVMATQNPIEQEGTYPLPEAQLDRFLMHVTIGYPQIDAERDILNLVRNEAMNAKVEAPNQIAQDDLFSARQEILTMHMAPEVEEYIIQLIMATRNPTVYGEELASWLEYGASPRGTISLDRCARAHAWIQGRDFVSPDDVQEIMFDVLRHRILLSFEAEASGVTPDKVLETIRERVPSA
jgi:MoxR-like ATPase